MDAVTSSTVATILARNHTSGPSVILLSDGSVIVSDGSHDDLGPQINLVIWALTGTSFGFLVLRIYCKALRQRGYWWDDYVLILAWDKITLAAASAFTSASVSLGYGKHLWDFKQEELIRLPLFGQTAGFFSILAALWSKTSFAMTVLRISSGWIRRLIWFIIMSLTIVMGSSALFQWIHCMPVEKTYDYRVEGTCWAPGIMVGYFMLTTIWSGTMDVVLALLPWKIIGGLVMSRKEKIGVMVAMSMGVFAGAASLIKATKVESLRSPDPADTIDLVIWGIAEGAITIIAASIPILRALLRDPNKSTTDNVSHYMEQKPSQEGQV